jgi:ABC-type Fe3+ transport system substrate-binding protein
MIDPNNRNVVAEASAIDCIAYNKRLITPEKVPNKWEDFLKPEFKGNKFLVDINPSSFANLIPELGEAWVIEYARKLKEQDPIWVRGQPRALTSIAAGEYGLHQLTYYHSCIRVVKKDPTNSLVCKVIEPVPAGLREPEAVIETAAHPYAALLWIEFLATPTGQQIIDEYDPLKSSIFAPGSELEKVIRGRKVSLNGWNTFHNTGRWKNMVVEAFGFPKPVKVKR